MNPFNLAKIFNPALDEVDNVEHLCYDENDHRRSHEVPKQEELNAFKRRQTKLFKDLQHVEYDEQNGGYNKFRQSILHKSLSRGTRGKMSCLHNQLSEFAHNPDLMAKTSINMDLMIIPEQSNSAPPKQGQYEVIPEESENRREKLLQLKVHEELFFHNLSILALIPCKRAELLTILDSHNRRGDQAASEVEDFDLVQQAEKRLRKL